MVSIMYIIFLVQMILFYHPLSLGLLVIFQSITLATMIFFNLKVSWFSLLVLLIYLGGILMLFCYIISLTNSSEKHKSKKSLNYFLLFFSCTCIMYKKNMFWLEKSNMETMEHISILFSSSTNITIFMLIFLLFIMIAVVTMTQTFSSSSRT